jgi:hypothetical protein
MGYFISLIRGEFIVGEITIIITVFEISSTLVVIFTVINNEVVLPAKLLKLWLISNLDAL